MLKFEIWKQGILVECKMSPGGIFELPREKDLKKKNNKKFCLSGLGLLIIPDVKFFISLKQCGGPVFSDQTKPMLIRGNRIIWQLIPGI